MTHAKPATKPRPRQPAPPVVTKVRARAPAPLTATKPPKPQKPKPPPAAPPTVAAEPKPSKITPDALLIGARLDETDEKPLKSIAKLIRKHGLPWVEERVALAQADASERLQLKKDGTPRSLGGRFFHACKLDRIAMKKAKKRAAKLAAKQAQQTAEASP